VTNPGIDEMTTHTVAISSMPDISPGPAGGTVSAGYVVGVSPPSTTQSAPLAAAVASEQSTTSRRDR
jgi:hypothetical protein